MQNQHVKQIVSDVLLIVKNSSCSAIRKYEYAKRLVACKGLDHQDFEQVMREIARRVGV